MNLFDLIILELDNGRKTAKELWDILDKHHMIFMKEELDKLIDFGFVENWHNGYLITHTGSLYAKALKGTVMYSLYDLRCKLRMLIDKFYKRIFG